MLNNAASSTRGQKSLLEKKVTTLLIIPWVPLLSCNASSMVGINSDVGTVEVGMVSSVSSSTASSQSSRVSSLSLSSFPDSCSTSESLLPFWELSLLLVLLCRCCSNLSKNGSRPSVVAFPPATRPRVAVPTY